MQEDATNGKVNNEKMAQAVDNQFPKKT